jgi:hypothetical protein
LISLLAKGEKPYTVVNIGIVRGALKKRIALI